MALGLFLVCVADSAPYDQVTRVIAVAAAILGATFLLDLNDKHRDNLLLPIVSVLCGIGIIVLWRLQPYLATKQILWMIGGVALMTGMYFLIDDVRSLSRLKYTCGIGAIVLILITMVIGEERNGARLWINVMGHFSFQPTELAKILMTVFLAGYLADKGELIGAQSALSATGRRLKLPAVEFRFLAPVLLIALFCVAVFVLQKDLGAALLLMGLFIAIMYLGTGRGIYAVIGLVLFAIGAAAAYRIFPHVATRIDMWLNPWSDPLKRGYQMLQSLFCLGEGGVAGAGLGLGAPKSLPAAPTDLVFAVFAEDTGLMGSVGLLLLFLVASVRGYWIAWNCRDRFGALLAAGLSTVFALQTIVIVGGVIKLIPLTGITLPFVSYGGTSVIANFISIGLLLCISRDCVARRE
jgi:cell division protein FtsW (lipid II flippase)